MAKQEKPKFDDTEPIEAPPSFDETEAIDEPQKKNPTPLPSSVDGSSLESTAGSSASVPQSISKDQIKSNNKQVVSNNMMESLKEKTRNQLLSNPAMSSPKALGIYINTLSNTGKYSENQINDLKNYSNKVVASKQLFDENSAKVNQDPSNVDASYKTALGLLGMGKYDEAINLFNATLGHLSPDKQDLGQSTQQDAMATNMVTQKAASTNPSNSLYGIGYALSSKKDYQGAVDYYNQALEADPTNANAQKGLAYAKSQLGLKEEASAHLKEAKVLEQNNQANEALVGQIGEQADQEREQQRQSDQMKTTADALEAFVMGDPEGKLGKFGYLNPLGKWYSGVINGSKTVGQGLKELSEGEVVSGGLTTTLGLAETAFAASGEANAFNEVMVGIKSAAELLPEDQKEVVNKVVDFPFQSTSMLMKTLGYDPEEGSNGKKVLEIADIVASFGAMKIIHSGVEKVSEGISNAVNAKSSIQELQDLTKKVAEGNATPEEISQLKEASSAMEDVRIEDIKKAAEEKGTPEAKEIADKISDVQKENQVSPEADKMHDELSDLETQMEKPLSEESKSILQEQIDNKKGEIASHVDGELDNQVSESVNQVSANELNDRIESLKSDLENTDNPQLKESINSRISDLENQMKETGPAKPELNETVEVNEPVDVESGVVEGVKKELPLGKTRDKSFLNRVVKESSVPDSVKAEVERKGLKYATFSNDVAQKFADKAVEGFQQEYGDNWHDAAINYASEKREDIPLSINAGIMGRVVSDFIDREKAATTPEEKLSYAERAADASVKLDEAARDAGRFGSMMSKVYEMTPLGIEARIRKQIENINNKKLGEKSGDKSNRERTHEAFEAFEKLKTDFDKEVNAAVEGRVDEIYEKLPTERKKKADRAIEALSNIQKKIKINSYSSVIPPDVIVAGIEVIKQSIKAGVAVADAIELGIKNIKTKYKEWENEDKFRNDMLEGFKEEGIELEEGKNAKLKSEQEKILDKIFPKKRIESVEKRKKLHEKIIEAYNAGALDYDKFEKLFYDKFGLTDMDNGKLKEFLRTQSERIHNAAEGGLKEREYTNLLNFVEDQRKQSKLEWVTTPFYANILSGYETHLNNAQFNAWSSAAKVALLAQKNPIHARYLANQMLAAVPQGLKEGGNILRTGLKFGEEAKPESLAERRADKGPGISHYFKLPGRLLKAGDAIFNTPIRAMKRSELLLKVAENYNKTLPESERMSKKEIEAAVNDITYNTTERKAEAYDQAVKDIQKLEGKDVNLNDPKIQRDIKLRQFEIMESSRPPEKYAEYGIDHDKIKEESQQFANEALLQGKPVGTLGFFSSVLHNIGDGLPITKFALTTFIDVPLNLTNALIDRSVLGLVRMAAYKATGKRGALITENYAERNNIRRELTPDQEKEAWLKAVNYTTALVGVAGLAYTNYTDENGKVRPILDVTADGTGDYRKNRALEQANGYKEYTADFMGHKFNYKYNAVLSSMLAPIGAVKDYEKYKDKNPEEEKHVSDRVMQGLISYLKFSSDQANIQGWRDIFASQPGKAIDESNWSEQVRDWGAKGGGKILRNMLVPNLTIQANKDIKGLLGMADKKPSESIDYLLKDVPFVESILENKIDHLGREVKSQFHLPVALVPDKLNMSGNDPYYKMFIDHKYYPRFATKRVVFDGKDEVVLSQKQMDEVNKIRGKYVMDQLSSNVEIKGKTYKEYLGGLSDEDFSMEMNKLFSEGETNGKSEVVGVDVEKEKEKLNKEKSKTRKIKGERKLMKLWENFRAKQ